MRSGGDGVISQGSQQLSAWIVVNPPALRRVGFGGALHVAPQDEPLGPIEVVARGMTQLRLAL